MAATADAGKTPSRWIALGRALAGSLGSRRIAIEFWPFAPWPDNVFIRTFLYDLNLKHWAIALLAGMYWLLPLCVAAWDRTLLRSGDVDTLVATFTGLGLPHNVSNALIRATFGNGIAGNALAYLRDITQDRKSVV